MFPKRCVHEPPIGMNLAAGAIRTEPLTDRTSSGAESRAAASRIAGDVAVNARPNISQPVSATDHLRETAWQLPWLRLHLTARELLRIPTRSYAGPAAKRALEQCAELRRRMIEAGTFN